jgi:hypothetical protein
VLLQELHDAVDELLPLLGVLGHGRVLGAALVPSADGHGHLQLGERVLEVGSLLEAGEAVIVLLKKLIFGQSFS